MIMSLVEIVDAEIEARATTDVVTMMAQEIITDQAMTDAEIDEAQATTDAEIKARATTGAVNTARATTDVETTDLEITGAATMGLWIIPAPKMVGVITDQEVQVARVARVNLQREIM